MAIPASEHCNPCENADVKGARHAHRKGVMCNRRMYGGDFFCDCVAWNVPDAIEAVRPAGRSRPSV
jgi:hypothetical protein